MCAYGVLPVLAVIAFLEFLPGAGFAYASQTLLPTTLYATSFENWEGYSLDLPLIEQNGWGSSGSGGDGILTNGLPGQTQSAYLGFNAPTNGAAFHAVGQQFNLDPVARQMPKITFSVQMAVFPSSTTNQEWFDWAVFNTDGEKLFALEFPTGNGTLPIYYQLGGSAYQDSGKTYASATAYTLTVAMDFAANRWSANLGPEVIVTNQPISNVSSNTLTLGYLDAQWYLNDPAHPGDDYMVFDDYQLTATRELAPGSRVLYSTSFEASEGFQSDTTLAGQNDWLSAGSGGDGLVTNLLPLEPQSAFLGFTAPTNGESFHAVGYHVDFQPVEQRLPQVTFTVRLAVFPSSSTHQGWFDWAVFNTDGQQLIALEFPTGTGDLPVYFEIGDAEYQDTGQTYLSEASHLLTIHMDFASNRWDAILDSAQLVSAQPLTVTNYTLSLGNVDAQWYLQNPAQPEDEYMLFDQYQITASPAAGSPPGPSLQLLSSPAPGQVRLRLSGLPGTTYTLETSQDLRRWTSLTTLSSATGQSDYTDTSATGLAVRFYRASAGGS